MAAVGQACPQAMQFTWQPERPVRKFSDGVHRPCTPDSKSEGWMMLEGHTRMHWPQRMQRLKNLSSSSDPGGRMSCALRPVSASAPTRHKGTVSAPAATATMAPRREISVTGCSPAADGRAAKPMRPLGHWARQFMHITHSLCTSSPDGRQAPSQYCSHRRQSPQRPWSDFPTRQGAKRLRRPSIAPSGQRKRQKKRGRARLSPITAKSTAPNVQADS